MRLLRNARIYAPEYLGIKDILTGQGCILAIGEGLSVCGTDIETTDLEGRIVTPGFIDQHVHITGAGGQQGFGSMTPAISPATLIACGTTTVLGLLGTDGTTRTLEDLYAKVKGLRQFGLGSYMLTGYFAYPPVTITGSVRGDMTFIDEVIGCKMAIADERCSYPTAAELARLITDIHVTGMLTGKKGVLHIHLGAQTCGMDVIFQTIRDYGVPVRRISPTHLGRTRDLFEQGIEFAKMGGMMDISTGGTKFDQPYRQILEAIEQGVPLTNITLSSDGNAGVVIRDGEGNITGFRRAPVDQNLVQTVKLIQEGGMDPSDALRVTTTNPAENLSLPHKGRIAVGSDADLCVFDDGFLLRDVIASGKTLMSEGVTAELLNI